MVLHVLNPGVGRMKLFSTESLRYPCLGGIRWHPLNVPSPGASPIRLVRLYTEWDKPEEALRWQTEFELIGERWPTNLGWTTKAL